ncbi:MAG: Gfo/Idh/MocA family oxidoreductase [Bacteroidales bacterium]|nr:Gfo/Idh/MocA family oxidoreductase [Bacteroidales bacterium]MBN2764067.1 Gfo/Idh/MocA family oxidoreductase [Bacteroidales bacterium]
MKKLKMGLVGGGKGSFIGKVHHMAALLDNHITLVCGAFSHNPEISKLSGRDYHLPDDRIYENYADMICKEKKLSEDLRMDFLSIVTPNNLHFGPARMALESGFHVVCDKPMTFSLQEALALKQIVRDTGLIFALTHTYTGYPMVKHARHIISTGQLGNIRKVLVEYAQGWLSTPVEKTGNKQAAWRTDPKSAGITCTMGDVGTHAANLAEYITGLTITQVCADLTAFVPGRSLDDDGSVLLRFDNGARGVLTASQICAGEENALKIQVYGEKGGLEWHQMDPNTLILKWPDRPKEMIRTGVGQLSDAAMIHTRVPAGHPEGYLEAFANIYRNFALAVKAYREGKSPNPLYDFPGIEEGIRGMLFLEKVVESSSGMNKWVDMKKI